jgi:hypothetical protein
MITVLVGAEKKPFTVHRHSICAKSKVFKAACRWTTSEEVICLPEESPEYFEDYLKWVYISHVEISNAISANGEIGLMRMYLLGVVLDDYQLRNAMMERLIKNLNLIDELPTFKEIGEVYTKTSAGSPLRRFLVIFAMHLHDPKAPGAAEVMVQWPGEFLAELSQALLLDRPRNGPADGAVMGSLHAALRDSIKPETDTA